MTVVFRTGKSLQATIKSRRTHQVLKIRDIPKALEVDPLKLPFLPFFIGIIILSRVLLLDLGFGLDADAWRIANSAFDLRYHLTYHASRFPGYPVPEIFNALVIGWGWLATNTVTMILSLVSVFVFAQILKIHNCRMRGLMTLTYAFMPLLWINSTNTMDYMWSLCFILLTWSLLLRKRVMFAGLMMGFAIGSRPQSVFTVIPFLFLIHGHGMGIRGHLKFLIIALISSLCLFTPVFLTYGYRFIRQYPAQTNVLQIGYGMLKQFGLPAVITMALLFFTSLKGIRKIVIDRNHNNLFIVVSLAAILTSFAALPYHTEYLIPAIPFGLIFFEKINKNALFPVLCGLLIVHAFVTIGSIEHVGEGQIKTRLTARGAINRNAAARKEQQRFVKGIIEDDIEEHSVVIVGPSLPILAYVDSSVSSTPELKMMYDPNLPGEKVCNFKQDICYRYLVPRHELEALLEESYNVYFIEGMREFTIDVHGYDLYDYKTTFLANP